MTHYESHPGKLLKEHLQEVATGARTRLDHPALRHRALLREAAQLIGLAHDLGKYTPYFQMHLKEGKRFEGGLERHAFMGAVLSAWLLLERLEELPNAPGQDFLPLLGYLAVHRHHGNLVAPEAILPPLGDPERATGELWRALRALGHQLDALRAERFYWTFEWEELGLRDAIAFVERPDLKRLFAELDKLVYRLRRLGEEEGARLCLWGQLLFSALIDADKRSAAQLDGAGRHPIPPDLVERFLRDQHSEPRHDLDRRRREFQQGVRRTVEALDPEEIPGSVFSLTAPTGLGKTFAALDAALRLRAKLQALWGEEHAPRVVYALPFITIIEQNYWVFRDAFRMLCPQGPVPEALLLRHHHLAEIVYRTEDEHLPLDQALLMVETWESEVVVTTFVQLFQSLVGYRNRFLKKLHNLIGAIVILDEAQALPMEHWPLLRNVFAVLRRELGLVVVQMTATRPILFPKFEVRELHPNVSALFREQKRTRLLIHSEEIDIEAWVERAFAIYEENGSLLCVLNTVRASLEVYKMLRERLRDRAKRFGLCTPVGEEWLVYLSTNIVPRQREIRLKELRRHLRAGGRALVVSTQVIEAGVDIDFPATIRDLGPVDAVVQVAGRCNREGTLPIGHVYLLPLKEGGCARVYGAIHTYVARHLFGGLHELPEPEYYELVERYFQETQRYLSQEVSKQLWQAYIRLAYDNLMEDPTLSEFHLIENPEQLPIVVPLTPEDERWLLTEFRHEVLEERNLRKRREAYLRHRRRLHDLTVRPLLRRALQNLPPSLGESEGLRWVPYGQMEQFYSTETGFIWEPTELLDAWID
jgi:CRISPR-associated endonuclease/helicase Cas3